MRTIAQLCAAFLLILAPMSDKVSAATAPTPDCTAERPPVPESRQAIQLYRPHYKPHPATEILDRLLKPKLTNSSPHGAEWSHIVVDGPLDLHQSIIPVAVSFEDVIFTGPVLLSQSRFPRGLNITGSMFLDGVDLSHVEIGSHLLAEGARFHGPVDLSGIKINGDFTLSGARFASVADLSQITVAGWLAIRNACFWGKVDISDSSIARGLDARGTKLLASPCFKKGKPTTCADFSSMSIGGTVDIRETLFQGKMDFSVTTIGGLLMARDAKFASTTDFSHLIVHGPASLLRTWFTGDVSLEHSTFARLDLTCSSVLRPSPECSGLPGGPSPAIDGMKYETISAGPGERAWESLVGFVQRARFSAQAYSALESFFRQQGYGDRANVVLVARQRAYRATLHPRQAPQKDAWSWLGNWYRDVTSAYGTQNARPLVVLTVILLFCAAFVFRPEYVEPLNPRVSSGPFNPLLYSVAVLVPGFHLYDASAWVQRRGYRTIGKLRMTARVLGWVLIGVYALNTAGTDILRLLHVLP